MQPSQQMSRTASWDEPLIIDDGTPQQPQRIFDRAEDAGDTYSLDGPLSNTSDTSTLSNNVDYYDRDADGNPKLIPVERTWAEWFQHFKPCFLVTLFALLKTVSTTLTGPLIPFLLVDYYGGGASGVKQAAEIQTFFDTGRAVLAFLMVPAYGKLLDTVGRRPFFILSAVLATLPPVLIFAFPGNPMWYIISNEVAQLLSVNSVAVAFLTDNYEESDRPKSIAYMNGVAGLGTLIAVGNGCGVPKLSPEIVYILSLVFAVARIPLAVLFIKETLPETKRKKFSVAFLNPNPAPAIRLILGQKILRRLTIIIAMMATTAVGTMDITSFYLIEKVGLPQCDYYSMAIENGVLIPFVLLLLFPFLSKYLRPTRLIFLAFVMMIGAFTAIMLITDIWMIFALVLPLLQGIKIGLPSLQGVFANAGEPGNQGMRMAGIRAVIDLVKAFTPLAISLIFKTLPNRLADLSYVVVIVCILPAPFIVWHWLPKWLATDREEQMNRALGIDIDANSAGSSRDQSLQVFAAADTDEEKTEKENE